MIVIPEHYDIEVDLDDSELEKSEGYLGSLQVNMESGDEAIGDFEDVDSEDSDPDEKDQDENDVAEFEELEDPDDELTEDDAEMHLDENQSDISPDGEEEASAPAQG
jgi:hypothetical protein